MNWCWWRTARKCEIDADARDMAARMSRASPGKMVPVSYEEAFKETYHHPDGRQPLIEEIFAVRVRNNMPWKRLMEIAFKHAPDETMAALREINENDQAVSRLVGELVK